MGDAAEAIVNGDDCEGCGEYIGPGHGYPRLCAGCDPKGGEATHILHPPEPRRRGGQRRARRADATTEFDRAAHLAENNGFRLRKCSDAHYQLVHVEKDWLLNIYPGNGRLYSDPHRKPPYFGLDPGFSLIEVVQRAIALDGPLLETPADE